MGIVIACEATADVGLAYHQNHVPVVREIVVANDGEEPVSDILLTLASDPPAIRPFQTRVDLIAPGGRARLEAPAIALDAAALRGSTEAVRLEVAIEVSGSAGPLARTVVPMRLLPPSHWGGGRSAPELVAAFVRPNDPAIDVVLHDAAAKLAAAGRRTAIDGYGEGGRTRVWDVAAAAWAALADRAIAYALPPASFERTGQKVRSPSDVLERAVATCLDTTLLYAAVLEQAGLDPVVVLVEGHALAGVWLVKEAVADATLDDARTLRKRRDLQELVLVETTFLTNHPPADFAAAVARGAAAVDEGAPSLDVAVDVRVCRSRGVRPMDLGDGTSTVAPAPVEVAPQALAEAPNFRDEVAAVEAENDGADRLERWKRRLLDLTLRNRLLNFKPGKAAIVLDGVEPAALEDLLAAGKALRFAGDPDGDGPPPPPMTEAERARRAAEALDRGELRVATGEKALGDRLLDLFRLSRNAFEEGGANVLFLAIGFLRWTRKGPDDASRAPLLLVPVALHRSSARAGFRLTAHDDESRINPTLLELLRHEFRLTLPALEGDLPRDASGLDVVRILDVVRAAVRDRRGWEVEAGVALTTLSFSTYLMWRDLKDQAEALKRNPVVRHLVETPSRSYGDGSAFPEPATLDRDWPPGEVFAPLPADSSQLSAVLAAAQGRDFVLFGPPGTGKSQTICNIVAQCLAGGKTVLFVSQKTAALEVVQRRLAAIGLGGRCLEVHSAKAQKSTVLAQLRRAWHERERTDASGWDEAAADLARSREGLNAFVRALHDRRPNGMTAHQGFGAVASSPAPPFAFAWAPDVEHAPADLAVLRRACRDLAPVLRAVGDPSSHPLAGMGAFQWSPRWRREVEAAIDEAASAMAALNDCVGPFAQVVRLEALADGWEGNRDLALLAAALSDSRAAGGAIALREDFDDLASLVEARDRHRRETDKLKARTVGRYREGVLSQDLDAMLEAWLAATNSNFLVRGGRQKQVASRLAVHAEGPLPTDVGPDLAALIDAKRHRDGGFAGGAALAAAGPPWSDEAFRIEDLEASRAWADEAAAILHGARSRGEWRGDPRAHMEALLNSRSSRASAALTQACAAYAGTWTGAERAMSAVGDLVGLVEADRRPAGAGWIAAERATLARWRGGLAGAQGWSAWQEAAGQARAVGLDPLVDALERGDLAADGIEGAFEGAHARWWIDGLVGSDETLRRFVPQRHEDAIVRFRALDAALAELSKAAILSRLEGGVPAPDAFGADPEWGLLSRELTKKRNHLPLRRLFAGMPRALTALTPCLMMSPLSIAQFLPADAPPFDVVVFDEASQIAPWYAVGAMARGRQLVIVGDPEQLPPTSVGDRGVDEIADGADVADQESILDECLAANVPRRNLDWHYRSRHESLIAFSNERYYAGRLVTFPSPLTNDRAVRLEHVADGLYERGAGRVNRPEARAVADWVEARLLDPSFAASGSSLGIVTFNGEQQRLVENLLDERRRARPELEPFFDRDRWREPVFVKNLENVQGDERDVIVFSVAVGRDAAGRVSTTVSSLNKQGGHRRLNVAVTRARAELVVFSSIRAGDIDLGRSGARGVRDFRNFLDYAENGAAALARAAAPTGAGHDSPFEAAVMAGLEAKGWSVHPQVGVSGFRVDLGIVHPDEPGRYLAGVECDGATYHRSATARDRDRLREMVLVDLGWRIRRVWSPEWWADAAAALAKLDAKLRADLEEARLETAARAGAAGEDASAMGDGEAPADPTSSGWAAVGPRHALSPTPDPDGSDARSSADDPDAETPAPPVATPGPAIPGPVREPLYAEAATPVAIPVAAPTEVGTGAGAPGAALYEVADLASPDLGLEPERLHELSYRRTLAGIVARLVAREAPMFEDVLVRRVARAHGIGRVGHLVRDAVARAIDPACAVTEEDGRRVVWPAGAAPAATLAFRRAAPSVRGHLDVPLAELAGLAAEVRRSRPGADPVRTMAVALELSRIEGATRARLERALAIHAGAADPVGIGSDVPDGG